MPLIPQRNLAFHKTRRFRDCVKQYKAWVLKTQYAGEIVPAPKGKVMEKKIPVSV
jgi:hypothetical protein